MTAAIILYDHVHPNGAFEKKSAIDVKGKKNSQITKELFNFRFKAQSSCFYRQMKTTRC